MTILFKVALVLYNKIVVVFLENALKAKKPIFTKYPGMDMRQSEGLQIIFQVMFEGCEWYFSQWYIHLKDSYISASTWETVFTVYHVRFGIFSNKILWPFHIVTYNQKLKCSLDSSLLNF